MLRRKFSETFIMKSKILLVNKNKLAMLITGIKTTITTAAMAQICIMVTTVTTSTTGTMDHLITTTDIKMAAATEAITITDQTTMAIEEEVVIKDEWVVAQVQDTHQVADLADKWEAEDKEVVVIAEVDSVVAAMAVMEDPRDETLDLPLIIGYQLPQTCQHSQINTGKKPKFLPLNNQ